MPSFFLLPLIVVTRMKSVDNEELRVYRDWRCPKFVAVPGKAHETRYIDHWGSYSYD